MGNNENTKHSNIFKHTRSSAKSISEHIGILYHFQSLVADHKHVHKEVLHIIRITARFIIRCDGNIDIDSHQ